MIMTICFVSKTEDQLGYQLFTWYRAVSQSYSIVSHGPRRNEPLVLGLVYLKYKTCKMCLEFLLSFISLDTPCYCVTFGHGVGGYAGSARSIQSVCSPTIN